MAEGLEQGCYYNSTGETVRTWLKQQFLRGKKYLWTATKQSMSVILPAVFHKLRSKKKPARKSWLIIPCKKITHLSKYILEVCMIYTGSSNSIASNYSKAEQNENWRTGTINPLTIARGKHLSKKAIEKGRLRRRNCPRGPKWWEQEKQL